MAPAVTVTEFLTSGSQRLSTFLKHLEHEQKFIYLLWSVSDQWVVQSKLILAQMFLSIYLSIHFLTTCTDVQRALFKTKNHEHKGRLTVHSITNTLHLQQWPYTQVDTAEGSVVMKWRACFCLSTLNEKPEAGEAHHCWQGRYSRCRTAFAIFCQNQAGKQVPHTPKGREILTDSPRFTDHIYATQPL